MTITNDIDYKNHVFEFPELTRIVGEPSTATLITLLNEVKSNAMSVHSDLGGGENGHLGLVVSPATYQTVVPDGVPYRKPANPGRFVIEGRETGAQITQRRAEHAKRVRVFKEVIGVERAIIQQIVSAVEPKYLKALRLPTTNRLDASIPAIFTHLFTNYGDISPTELRTLTDQVQNMPFHPQEPVDTIFTEIDDLATIAEMAEASLTQPQKINMAFLLFQKTQAFNRGLTSWISRPAKEQTWDNFKQHFQQAQLEMQRTRAITVQEAINHTQLMNLVSQGVQDSLQAHTLYPTPCTTADPDVQSTVENTSSDRSTPSLPELASANSATSSLTQDNATIVAMKALMDMMQKMMLQMQQNMLTCQPAATTGNSRSRPPRPARQQHPTGRNPNQQKYCHTHGACNHNSPDCLSKAEGHKDEATFANRMGGSTRNSVL